MHNIALIISTYDNSEDLWPILEQTYVKYWSNINFPIYLSTNHKEYESKIFHSLKVGDEISWSDNLIKSLNKINQRYILLTFDDLFLTDVVDNKLIEELMTRSMESRFNYLQFYRSISKGNRVDNLLFNKLKKTRYKNSAIWSFWDKEILLQLLKKSENAWQFERDGNIRSFKYNHFYSTRRNVIPFINGVVRGHWNPLAKKKLRRLGFSISSKRESLGFLNTIRYKLWDMSFDFFTFVIHKIY